MSDPITIDLSSLGGPEAITVARLTQVAAEAKERVKRSPRGWSLLSQLEIIALAWFADVHLTDQPMRPAAPAQPAPKPISTL